MLTLKKIILLGGDAFSLFLSLPLMLVIAFGNSITKEIFVSHLYPFLFIYTFILTVFYIIGLYDIRSFKPTTSLFANLFVVHILGAIFGMILFYLFTPSQEITPKTNLAITMFISTVLTGIWRRTFQQFISEQLKIRVAIAGINRHATELAKLISQRPYIGYNLSALINTSAESGEHDSFTIKTIFADKDLIENLKAEKIETVIIAENPHLNPILAQAFYECIPHKIQFLDLSQSYELLTGRIPISYINQTWFLENMNEKSKQLYDNIKRVIDCIAASTIILASLPFIPLVALAIKWESKGPVFYSQERVGRNKRLFRLIKFRSMIQDAERGKPVWAFEKDPRVTRVGAFLRRTHLDELPQMINILRGDLSLVGPRPERTEFVRDLEGQIPHYNIRHMIKPGFTGWAQVNFRYARTPMDTYEKFQYDLYYLKNRSLILDISILLKTFNLFFKKS